VVFFLILEVFETSICGQKTIKVAKTLLTLKGKFPCHYSCGPLIIICRLFAPLAQTWWIYIAGICGSSRSRRFSYNNFFRGYSHCDDFWNSSASPISRCMCEKLLIRIVLRVTLIIKLNIVPINHISNCSVDRLISSVNVSHVSDEIRSLWAMSNEVFLLGLLLSLLKSVIDDLSASNEPFFSNSIIHSSIIFPI